MDIEQGEECTEHAEGASGTLQVSPFLIRQLHRHQQRMMLSGQNGRGAAPAEELRGRAATVQRICTCLNNGSRELNVESQALPPYQTVYQRI